MIRQASPRFGKMWRDAPSFPKIWRILAKFGHIWDVFGRYLARFDNIRKKLAKFEGGGEFPTLPPGICRDLGTFVGILPDLAGSRNSREDSARLARFCEIWKDAARFGNVWQYPAIIDRYWGDFTGLDRIRQLGRPGEIRRDFA